MNNHWYKDMKLKLRETQVILLLIVAAVFSAPAYSAGVGQKAPDFSVQNILNGKYLSLKHYKGQVVYLDFWASWCKPCLKSFPFMEQLKQKYASRGLVVIAVGLDENPQDLMAFLERAEPASFVVAHNGNGDIASRYDVQVMPSTYLIGRDGKIKLRHLGFDTRDQEKIQKLIESSL